MNRRRAAEAKKWGGHLVWEVRQLCRLGIHLGGPDMRGKVQLDDAVDAAVLEAFILHARSLVEFVWRSNEKALREARREGTEYGRALIKQPPRSRAVLAEQYFREPADWVPGEMTELLAAAPAKAGWGLAHCSYQRLNAGDAREWDYGQITRDLADVLIRFARAAPHLDRAHADAIQNECLRALDSLPLRLDARGTPLPASVSTPSLTDVVSLADSLPADALSSLRAFGPRDDDGPGDRY